MKKLFAKLKTLIDTYKMWIFIVALFGTNGTQMYMNAGAELDEKTSPPIEKVKPIAKKPSAAPVQKTIIIHKSDNSYCDRKLNEHKNGSQH